MSAADNYEDALAEGRFFRHVKDGLLFDHYWMMRGLAQIEERLEDIERRLEVVAREERSEAEGQDRG